jgi:hypothetical protein
MNYMEQGPLLSQSKNGFPRFVVGCRIQELHERIEKDLTGLLEPDSVPGKIEVRLLHFPAKALAA